MTTALILVDFINEIVHEDGKLAKKGYSDFMKDKDIFSKLSKVIANARQQSMIVIHVRVGFSANYREQPKRSPLFGKAHEFEALKLDTWATSFHESIAVKDDDIIITKHRVSAFHATPLDLILRNNDVDAILVAGVATDLAVSNTVREAHDKDYRVTVIADCCAAANDKDHHDALASLAKIAAIQESDELF